MGCGVVPGTSTANHRLTSTPGSPASAKVGTSGRPSTRCGDVTARPRNVPAWTWPIAVEVPTMNIATSPAISAVIACADEPLYGTCLRSTLAADLTSSAARCGAAPTPIEL